MDNKSLRTAGLSLAVLLLASAGLTGCVTVQPEENTPGTSAPAATPTATETESSSPTESSPAPTTDSGTPTAPSPSGNFDELFSSIVNAADQKLECLNDDQAGRDNADDLDISESDKVISVSGDCDDVVVTGNNLTIAITEVDDLQVRGNNNTILVQDLDDVQVHGSDNTVGWNPVHEDDPDLDDRGSNNTLRHDAVQAADLDL